MARIDAIDDLSPESLAVFDEIIDVRSPSEYAEDHIPGAVSLPVLDDAERARIGAIYVQDSAFRARKVGASAVARNIAGHLEGALSDRAKGYRPLVYCWRGGMRSSAMATVMASIGWRVGVVKGGYRTWRRAVVAGLEHDAAPLPLVLIDGQTGAAKTAILRRLAAKGAQAIDLEGLAAHRGSAFGALANEPQPSQKRFETLIWDALRRFDLAVPIYVEAESNRVGARQIPRRLWSSMKRAPRIHVEAPAEARAAYLLRAYGDVAADREGVLEAIARLAHLHPKATIAQWRALAEAGDDETLARRLVVEHYDPAYERARRKRDAGASHVVRLERLDDAAIDAAAEEVLTELAPPGDRRPRRGGAATADMDLCD